MIAKSGDVKLREFKGVRFEVLAVGDQSMVTRMIYSQGNHVPFHRHPNEQSGYVISGRYIIRFGQYDQVIEAGDSYCIPADVEHSLEVIEPGYVIDVFVPPREDYL